VGAAGALLEGLAITLLQISWCHRETTMFGLVSWSHDASPYIMNVLVARDTRPYCVTVTLDDWQGRVARMVAREIRRYRDERKLSAQQLADRTAELGMEIPRSVLANLESGRRETVTVPEILVLAAALQVAPVELLCPVGFDEQIEILPGRMMDPLSASRWVDGELVLDVTGPSAVLRAPAAGEGSSTRLAERHAGLLEEIHRHEADAVRAARDLDVARVSLNLAEAVARDAASDGSSTPEFVAAMEAEADKSRQAVPVAEAELRYKMNAAQSYREAAAQSLRYIRAEMRERGMFLPALPSSLRLDEEVGPAEGSEAR
jgi:transcriptional regulator with XRE-family HTH domain